MVIQSVIEWTIIVQNPRTKVDSQFYGNIEEAGGAG
jgi:hypothetical protein